MALGYIAAFSETLALAVVAEKGLEPLCAAVAQESEDHIRAAAAWSLGQVGRHTPDHAKAVADTGRDNAGHVLVVVVRQGCFMATAFSMLALYCSPLGAFSTALSVALCHVIQHSMQGTCTE